ncbi:hypothetical protein ES708_29735 [subsurface metagenome]
MDVQRAQVFVHHLGQPLVGNQKMGVSRRLKSRAHHTAADDGQARRLGDGDPLLGLEQPARLGYLEEEAVGGVLGDYFH